MDFLFEYLMFLGQVVTLVVAFLIIASSLAGLSGRQHGDQGHLVIRKLNERVRELRFTMENHLLTAEEAKRQHKSESKREKAEAKKAAKAAKLAAKQKPGVKKTAVADEQGDSDAGTEGQGVAEVAPKLEGQKDRTFVIHFDGDTAASGVDFLSVEISAVLTMAGANDEVVICLESPGGMVHSYGSFNY